MDRVTDEEVFILLLKPWQIELPNAERLNWILNALRNGMALSDMAA